MGHPVLLLDGYLRERPPAVGREYGIESESAVASLHPGDEPAADPGDDDPLAGYVASDAAPELGAAVGDAFHEPQYALVADRLLGVGGPNPREPLEVVHEQAGIVYDVIPDALALDLVHALGYDLLEIRGLHLVVSEPEVLHLDAQVGERPGVFGYLPGIGCDDLELHV